MRKLLKWLVITNWLLVFVQTCLLTLQIIIGRNLAAVMFAFVSEVVCVFMAIANTKNYREFVATEELFEEEDEDEQD